MELNVDIHLSMAKKTIKGKFCGKEVSAGRRKIANCWDEDCQHCAGQMILFLMHKCHRAPRGAQ